jgi:hypothetical protein
MAAPSHFRSVPALSLVIVASYCSGSAQSAWLTIKNDTNQAIVVQENVVVNGQTKRGKPINLLPGEKLREYIPAPTMKNIEVFDVQNPKQAVWSGNLNCNEEKQTFSVSSKNGKIAVGEVDCPQKDYPQKK